MRYKSLVLIPALTLQLFASCMTVNAQPYTDYPWVYEDFESGGEINATCSNASIENFSGGVGDSKGAARIKVNKDYGTAKFPLNLKAGTTYNVSAWVKMIGNVPQSNSFHFIFYMHQKLADGSPAENASCFKDISVGNVEYSTEDYVYISTTFKYEGKGRLNGADVETCNGHSTVEIRVGDGKLSTTGGSPIDYLLDDLIVEPVMEEEDPQEDEDTSVGFINGNFENGYDNSVWRSQNCTITNIDGAAGTKNGVMITSTGNYGQIKQRAPMQYNKAYRISLYTKAGDDATIGKELRLIIDRKDGKTDEGLSANYEYLPTNALISEPQSIVLTDEWQKAEFIYKNSSVTYETNEPYIYPRVGSGTGMECYCLDEMEIEELPDIVYNGDFSNGTIGWKADGATAEISDDVPQGGAFESVRIKETSNQGALSQGINVLPGHTYEITFNAKGEGWQDTEAQSLELYPVLDRYESNSLEDDFYEYLTCEDGYPAALTKEWQSYRFIYDCQNTAVPYRIPIFYLKIGNGKQRATYLMNNVVITDITESETEPDIEAKKGLKNLTVEGKAIEGYPLTFTYEVEGCDNIDGIVKIMKSFGGKYVSVGSARADGSAVSYTPSKEDVGSVIKFTAVVIEDETPSEVKSALSDELKHALNIKPAITSGKEDSVINANVVITNNDADIKITAVLAAFDENNAMTAMTEKSVNSLFGIEDTLDLSLDNPGNVEQLRLFVWEGTSAAEATMNSLVENISVK